MIERDEEGSWDRDGMIERDEEGREGDRDERRRERVV